ncbi:glycosyltransferase family 39 protein [Candidatus Dependentiae bacterium]|nr:glycosyltransferase family 39 protein [Candidatus Dependentiae bacterium]
MKKTGLYFSLGILIVVLFFYALFRRLDNDELEAIHTAWKILFDGQIYKDFFQNHNPFLYYLLAPVIKLFGETTRIIYVMRIMMFLMTLGIGYATYLLAKTITNKTVGLLSTIMLYSLPIIATKIIDIRPDTPMILCSMLAVAVWFVYLESKKPLALILSTILLSASFLFLQKAIFLIFFFGLVILYQRWQKKIVFREILVYGATFLILPSCYLTYLLYTNSLIDYINCAWLFNKHMVGWAPAFPTIQFAFLTNIPWWFMFFMGLYFSIKKPKLWSILFLTSVLTGVFYLVPYSYPQYLVPALPFATIIAAYGLYHITKQHKNWLIPMILLVSIPPTFTNYIRRVMLSPVSEQIEKINYILSITDKNDYVLDSEIGFEGFNLFRKDIDFLWIGILFSIPSFQKIKPYNYNVYEKIEEKRPKVIGILSITKIPAQCIDKNKNHVIEKYYKKSDQYNDILIRK